MHDEPLVKLTLQQVQDTLWLVEALASLPEELRPYFEWWVYEMADNPQLLEESKRVYSGVLEE